MLCLKILCILFQKTELLDMGIEDNGFNYSLSWQVFQFSTYSIYYLWNDLFEYGVLKGATLSRLLWEHILEQAKILGQWFNIQP